MANCVAYNLLEKCCSILSPLCVVHHEIVHAYIMHCPVKEMACSFDLENLHQSDKFEMQK